SNGSDFTVMSGTDADNPTAASCPSGTTSTTVNLTVPNGAQPGNTLGVTAKTGSDGDTVKDPGGSAQPVGDAADVPFPTYTSLAATVGSTTMTVSYDEAVTCSSVDAADFSVSVGGSADP